MQHIVEKNESEIFEVDLYKLDHILETWLLATAYYLCYMD